MESECIDLLVTDPPYKTISGGCKDGKRTKRPKGILKRNSGTLFAHQNVNIYDWMPEVLNYIIFYVGKRIIVCVHNFI